MYLSAILHDAPRVPRQWAPWTTLPGCWGRPWTTTCVGETCGTRSPVMEPYDNEVTRVPRHRAREETRRPLALWPARSEGCKAGCRGFVRFGLVSPCPAPDGNVTIERGAVTLTTRRPHRPFICRRTTFPRLATWLSRISCASNSDCTGEPIPMSVSVAPTRWHSRQRTIQRPSPHLRTSG